MKIQSISFGNRTNAGKIIAKKVDGLRNIDLTKDQLSDSVRLTWQRIGIRNNPNIIVRHDQPFEVTYSKAIIITSDGTKTVQSKKSYPLKNQK